ncbi:MAG TPA: RNA polymerase sigma factor [Candidatus Paceibacterota bacterium]
MDDDTIQAQFLETYDRLADSIYRYARMRLSDHDAALDLTQETFMRYWRHLSEGKPVAHERALLFTIVRRLVIDRYRARRTESLDQLQEDAGFEPSDERELSPDARAEGARALSLVAQLPEDYRDAVFLRYVEGLEPRDIAAALDLSANVVSVRIHRGVEKLRALMHTDDHA